MRVTNQYSACTLTYHMVCEAGQEVEFHCYPGLFEHWEHRVLDDGDTTPLLSMTSWLSLISPSSSTMQGHSCDLYHKNWQILLENKWTINGIKYIPPGDLLAAITTIFNSYHIANKNKIGRVGPYSWPNLLPAYKRTKLGDVSQLLMPEWNNFSIIFRVIYHFFSTSFLFLHLWGGLSHSFIPNSRNLHICGSVCFDFKRNNENTEIQQLEGC